MSNQNARPSQGFWLALLPTILYAAILPYVIYRLASSHMATIPALLLAGIPPALWTVYGLIRRGRLNLLGTLSLLGIAVKLLSALLFKDTRLVLISDSLMIGVYGAIMLASLLVRKPILLVLAQNMLSDAPPEQREQLERRWSEAGTQRYFMLITAIWGTGLFLVLVVCIVLAYTVPVAEYLLLSPIIQYSMFGTLLLGSQIYGGIRRYRKSRSLAQTQ